MDTFKSVLKANIPGQMMVIFTKSTTERVYGEDEDNKDSYREGIKD